MLFSLLVLSFELVEDLHGYNPVRLYLEGVLLKMSLRNDLISLFYFNLINVFVGSGQPFK